MIRKTRQLSELNMEASYLEAGSGAPLILIHGVGMCAESWFPQIETLSRCCRVIAVDLPGHGHSEGFDHEVSLKDYVSWFGQFLNSFSETSFSVAGHSMGALITAGIAIEQPTLIRHAIVISGVYRRSVTARDAVMARAQELMAGQAQLDSPLSRWFTDDPVELQWQEKVRGWLNQVNVMGYAKAYQAFANGDLVYADGWSTMQPPVLVMTGEFDANSTPEMTEMMAAAAPYGTAVVVKDARHMLTLTDAARVSQEILTFMNAEKDGRYSSQIKAGVIDGY